MKSPFWVSKWLNEIIRVFVIAISKGRIAGFGWRDKQKEFDSAGVEREIIVLDQKIYWASVDFGKSFDNKSQ
jgi:hypothetical protein